jgi:flagellar hook-basal body complex protein FliE
MNNKGKIKVIKKGTQVTVQKRVEKNSTKETARQMVSNVTNWVSDFQQRRRDETKQAIENLFAAQPQPSGI